MSYEAWRSRLTGNAFDDEDVARCYARRPPYAAELFDFLRALAPARACLVDLGCGPGKLAAELANDFTDVTALDPSGPMIAEARRRHGAWHPNIRWLVARAEDAELPAHIDLVTAGTAIHWMDHVVLFPRLAARTALLAVVNLGRGADPPWTERYRAFMTDWLARIGQTYDETAFDAKGRRFERWLDIGGRTEFRTHFRQSVADYVTAMHSTATFSRSRMGAALATQFGDALATLMAPYAEGGVLTFETVSELTWGVPRAAPKD